MKHDDVRQHRMDTLQPFIAGVLPPDIAGQLELYLDLLLKWNARVNLTAIRGPDEIVTRHFGESLFAAGVLFGNPGRPVAEVASGNGRPITLADVGSGAGFPGIPMKLWAPQLELTLLESQNKKCTFLREVIRTLQLKNSSAFCGRAEDWNKTASIVTLRAVEQFERVLPVAARLVEPGGKLCLLIGAKQVETARNILGGHWVISAPARVPRTEQRVVAVAQYAD